MSDYLDQVNPENLLNVVAAMQAKIQSLELRPVQFDSLEEVTNDLGDQRAGRFLALSSGSEPTDEDANGAFISALGEQFGEFLIKIGVVKNGRLQIGFGDALALFAGGLAWIDEDGISATNLLKWLIKQSATNSTYTRTGKLGMALQDGGTIPVWELSFEAPAGTELVTNGGAENGDFTGWTKTSGGVNWSISSSIKRTGSYSYKIQDPGVLTSSRITVVENTNYLCSGYCLNNINYGKIEVKWYNDPTAGTLLRTDLVIQNNAKSVFTGNSALLKAPVGSLSCVIVLTSTASGGNSYFDDIAMSAVAVDQKFQVTDDGLDCTNGLYPATAEMWADQVITSVTLARTISATYQYGFYYGALAANANDGDEYSFKFILAKGSYAIRTLGVTSTGCGKLDYYIDGVLVGSGQDWYSTGSPSALKTITNVNIPTGGLHTLKMKVNGKNASSSDYVFFFTKLWIQ